VINLGCVRNLVDSQLILERIQSKNFTIVDGEESDIVIVNTCGFIEDAKKESIDVILDLIQLKREGKIKKIVIAGCLAQRYADELVKGFKEIDAIVGVLPLDKNDFSKDVLLTPTHYAYVKICESCIHRCSFCTIPSIKGKFVSRSRKSISEEIKFFDKKGVKEINLIGQDTTAYGQDLYHELSLSSLLEEIIPLAQNIEWIRLFYAFPSHITPQLIELMSKEKKICRYFDLPLQHVNDKILRAMNRGITKSQTVELIQRLRSKIPGIHLRTTFIVGFPGETDEDFAELLEFIKKVRFERLGAFMYSREEGTPAASFKQQVPQKVKRKRFDVLMQEQKKIALEIQKKFLGKKIRVLIDEKQKGEDNVYLARTEFDAPEVDGVVYVHAQKTLSPGNFVEVLITDTLEYDLVGEYQGLKEKK